MKKINNIVLIRVGSSIMERVKHPWHCFPPLSLKYAQVLLEQKGYNVKLVDRWVTPAPLDELLKIILNWPADLVVISITTFTSEEGTQLGRLIKSKKDIVVVGVGQDVTVRHRSYLELNRIFDIIIRGEFEQEILFLIEQLKQPANVEKVRKLYQQEKSKEEVAAPNLNDFPSLSWQWAELKNYPFVYPVRLKRRVRCGYLSTSRGCPHNCIFCSPVVRKSNGKVVRFRKASRVVDEIEELQKIGVNFISFEDDNFTTSKEHVLSICREIQRRKIDIKWAAHARIDEVPLSLLTAMKKAGCSFLLLGVESGSDRVINILQKVSSNLKWSEKAKAVFGTAKRLGIATCALFIIGSPTETKQEIEQSMRLADYLKPDLIKVHFFTLYPGSVAYEQLRTRIDERQLLEQHHYLQSLVNVSNVETLELKNMQIKFYRKFLFNPYFIMSHLRKYVFFYFFNLPMSLSLIKRALFFLFSRR